MMHILKPLAASLLIGMSVGPDTKTYEKDLKLTISLTKLGTLSDRGIVVGIQNLSKSDHEISVVAQQKQNDSPLYVSFTALMDDGTGKFEEIPCKYRTPQVKDYPGGTQVQTVGAGKSMILFSMLFEPKKMFLLNRIGSIKLVAHYKYQQKQGITPAETAIPTFTLHSDTIIVNTLK